jgi:hypothetical protein
MIDDDAKDGAEACELQHFEFYLHRQGQKPSVVGARREQSLRSLLVTEGHAETETLLVFVGECIEALDADIETDEGADAHPPVEIELTVEVLEIERHRHVHVHRCRHIAVEVSFLGKTKRRRFSPATTIAVVTAWARKALKLEAAAAAEYVLQICGTKIQPRSDEHLGEVAALGACAACFELVVEVTPQG